jgi:hypothetical protein
MAMSFGVWSLEGGATQAFDRQYDSIVDRRQVVDVAAIFLVSNHYMTLRISMHAYTVVYLVENKLWTIFFKQSTRRAEQCCHV